jgi:hypothetical protein
MKGRECNLGQLRERPSKCRWSRTSCHWRRIDVKLMHGTNDKTPMALQFWRVTSCRSGSSATRVCVWRHVVACSPAIDTRCNRTETFRMLWMATWTAAADALYVALQRVCRDQVNYLQNEWLTDWLTERQTDVRSYSVATFASTNVSYITCEMWRTLFWRLDSVRCNF